MLVLTAGCLIDVDIADNRRTELLADSEPDLDSGQDTGSDSDTDAEIVPADCSGVPKPAPVGAVSMIRSSGRNTCVLSPGNTPSVECRVPEDSTLVDEIPNLPYSSIGMGRGTFCGVKASDRSIVCAGEATDIIENTPEGTFSAVALTRDAEGNTACGLRVTGEITCWGNNDYGLVSGAPSADMCTVTVAQHHACGIRANGTLECWGSGTEGVAGESVPTGTFRDVSVGRDFACAVSSIGEPVCWGISASWSGEEAMPDLDARWIAASNHAACALTDENLLSCWGPPPNNLPVDEEFEQITPSNHGVCAVRADESWDCFSAPPGGPPP